VKGEMVLMDVDEESYRLLRLSEVIGVGKQTVMGLGRIEIRNFGYNKDDFRIG